jgi:hypothetical protein
LSKLAYKNKTKPDMANDCCFALIDLAKMASTLIATYTKITDMDTKMASENDGYIYKNYQHLIKK